MTPDVSLAEDPRRTRADLVVTATLFVVFLALYAVSLSNHLTGDSIWYAHDIFMPGEQYFHPHHLLYNPLMRLILTPFTALLGAPEARLIFLQWINVLISALASAAFGLVVLRLGAGRFASVAFALLLGLSGSFYFYSSQIEVYGAACLFLCVALLGAIRSEDARSGRLITAFGFAAAMLFHQTAIFFGLPILLIGLARHRRDPRRLIGYLSATLALPIAAVGLAYLVTGIGLGHRDPVSFWHWVTMHVQYGFWGHGGLASGTLRPALQNLLKALIVAPPGARWWPWLLLGVLVLYPLARLAADGRDALRNPWMIGAGLTWTAMLAGFSTWWDAEGAEFWGMVLLPAYLTLSCVAPAAAPRRRLTQEDSVAAACLAAGLILIAASAIAYHRVNLRPGDVRQAARAVPEAARDGDLVYAVGTDRSTYYRIYLAGRPVTVLAINVKPADQAGRRSTGTTFTSAMIDVIEEEARAVEARGGRCLVDHWVLEGRISTTRLTRDLKLEEFTAGLRERFLITPVASGTEVLFYRLHPPPRAAGG